MSRPRRRNPRRNDGNQRAAAANPTVDRRTYVSVKTAALRLILAALTEDDDTRPARIILETIALREHGDGMIHGVLGYLLTHVTDGLTRGYGGPHGAIDAVTSELAASVIESQGTDGRE